MLNKSVIFAARAVALRHAALLFALAVSLTLHIAAVAWNPGKVFNDPVRYGAEISYYGSRDASLYAKMADQILVDHVYGYNSTQSNAYVTPGYPVYLVTIFAVADIARVERVKLVRGVNAVLSVLTVALLYSICLLATQSRRLAFVSALMYALYFSPLHYFRTLLTEVPGIFVLYAALLAYLVALERRTAKWHAIFALTFCAGLMIRPTPAPLIVLAAIPVIFRYQGREALRTYGTWLVCALVVFLPWMLRNYLVLGDFSFSSHGGNPLLAGTNPFNSEEFSSIMKQAAASGMTQGEVAMSRITAGFDSQPDLWISWFTTGKLYWLFSTPSAWHGYLPELKHLSRWVYGLHYLILLFSLAALVFRKNSRELIVAGTIIGYILISLVFLANDRYGFFAIPGMCILAAVGMKYSWIGLAHFARAVKARATELLWGKAGVAHAN